MDEDREILIRYKHFRILIEEHQAAYKQGFKDGVETYAWWKDGTEYVGTCGHTLKEAYKQIDDTKVEVRHLAYFGRDPVIRPNPMEVCKVPGCRVQGGSPHNPTEKCEEERARRERWTKGG